MAFAYDVNYTKENPVELEMIINSSSKNTDITISLIFNN